MKTDLLLPVATAALLAIMLLGISPDKVEAHQSKFPDYGAQIVDLFPDFTIKYVNAFSGKRE